MSDAKNFFRGWAKPGVNVSGTTQPEAGETLDALSGNFRIFQLKDGHRFSTDDLLAAWYGTTWCPSASRVLDLGSGIGSVGLVAAWRLPGAKFVTIEAQQISAELAKKSAAYNGVSERYEIRVGDFRDSGLLGDEEKFDLILGSPPYFPLGSGVTAEHPQKVACRFEVRGEVADYCRVAAPHLNSGGVFAIVFPIQPEAQLARVQNGARAAGLTIVRQRPIILREGEPPLLGVFVMMCSEHLPENFRVKTWSEPPLIIRACDGSVHP